MAELSTFNKILTYNVLSYVYLREKTPASMRTVKNCLLTSVVRNCLYISVFYKKYFIYYYHHRTSISYLLNIQSDNHLTFLYLSKKQTSSTNYLPVTPCKTKGERSVMQWDAHQSKLSSIISEVNRLLEKLFVSHLL